MDDELHIIVQTSHAGREPMFYGPVSQGDAEKIALRALRKWETVTFQYLSPAWVGLGRTRPDDEEE